MYYTGIQENDMGVEFERYGSLFNKLALKN
jgi:hypothetical protein